MYYNISILIVLTCCLHGGLAAMDQGAIEKKINNIIDKYKPVDNIFYPLKRGANATILDDARSKSPLDYAVDPKFDLHHPFCPVPKRDPREKMIAQLTVAIESKNPRSLLNLLPKEIVTALFSFIGKRKKKIKADYRTLIGILSAPDDALDAIFGDRDAVLKRTGKRLKKLIAHKKSKTE